MANVARVTRFFDVKPRDAGFVIGKGGRTIKRIAEETHTHIEFEKRAHPFSPRFRVEGQEWRVNEAIEKIRFVAIEGEKRNSKAPLCPPPSPRHPHSREFVACGEGSLKLTKEGYVAEVPIKQVDIGFVIGEKGKTINMIGRETGCHVCVCRCGGRCGVCNPSMAAVIITGPNVPTIEKAKAFVFKVANEAIDRRANKAVAASNHHTQKSEIERKFPVHERLLPAGAMTTGLLVRDSKTGKLTNAIYDPVKECFVSTPPEDKTFALSKSNFPPLSDDTTSATTAVVREPTATDTTNFQ